MKDAYLTEFAKNLSDQELKFLSGYYEQLLGGDRAEIANFLSKNREVDRWLQSAESAQELFEHVDKIGEFVKIEYRKRFMELSLGRKNHR